MEILNSRQMRSVDRRAIEELGISGLLLMESAGRGVAQALLRDYPDAGRSGVVVLCGKGNNGGDGLVVARHLIRQAVPVRVLLFAARSELRGDAETNLRAASASGVPLRELLNADSWERERAELPPDAIFVDALLGTGARGGAKGLLARVISDLNSNPGRVASIDLPSGVDADSIRVVGTAVRAERTYTLCRPKPALVAGEAARCAGRWEVLPIGIPDSVVLDEAAAWEWLDLRAASRLLPKRTADSHKGSYGHLLVVAGSRGKSGAAVLAARGALRAGAGLVTVATPASNLAAVAAQQAELMTDPLPESEAGVLGLEGAERVLELAAHFQALALGPGLGTDPQTRAAVLRLVEKRPLPTVVDADGLNALAEESPERFDLLGRIDVPLVITPHPGEAARLARQSTEQIQSERFESALELARRSGIIVVLKGHRTLIASPEGRLSVNATGNPGMATAGTGDVLTGIIGALLARGLEALDAARLAVWTHGRAGDLALLRRGAEGLISSDLVEDLPAALVELQAAEGPRSW